MTISETLYIDKLISLALGEVGYMEEAGNRNKYAAYLDSLPGFYNGLKNGFAWCDVFVDYCFVKTFGVELGTLLLCGNGNGCGAGCKYSAESYRHAGSWHDTPEVGDQVFFGTYGAESHTGIVIAVDDSTVTTVEGNTSDRVLKRKYQLTDGNITGYGRPRWHLLQSKTENTEAVNAADGKDNDVPAKRMKRADIEWLQKICIECGYDCGEIDGDLGPKTLVAVIEMVTAEAKQWI